MRFILFIFLLTTNHKSLIGREIHSIYQSPNFLGRGNSGLTAPSAEDSISYNPAALAINPLKTEKKIVILSPAFSISNNVEQLEKAGGDDQELLNTLKDLVGDPIYAGLNNFSGYAGESWGLGLISGNSASALIFNDFEKGGISTLSLEAYQNLGIAGAYAYTILDDRLAIGIGPKLVQRTATIVKLSIADIDEIQNFKFKEYQNSGLGFGVDLALSYKFAAPNSPHMTLVISDVGDTSFSGDDSKAPIPSQNQSIKLGASLSHSIADFQNHFFLDWHDLLKRTENNSLKNVHLGSTISHPLGVGLNLGLNQGYFSTGFFYQNPSFRFDLGSYGVETGELIGERASRRYFMRFMWTIGGENKAEPANPIEQNESSTPQGSV